tara:strand:+ start:651 stop:1037 length:387 start_codon:yes stop_codon:yes gene_type:complete
MQNRKKFLMKYIALGNEESLRQLVQWDDPKTRPQVYTNWEQTLLRMKNTANSDDPATKDASKLMIGWLLAEGQTGDVFPTLQPYTTKIGERLLKDNQRGAGRRKKTCNRRKRKSKGNRKRNISYIKRR